MEEICKYNFLSLEITLNFHAYDLKDLEKLMQDPFCIDYETKVGVCK